MNQAALLRGPFFRWLVGLPVLAALLWLAAVAVWRGQADFNGREARYRLDQAILGHAPMDEATWQHTRGLLERSLSMTPDDAIYNEDLANLHFLRAAQARGDARLLKIHYEAALAQYLRAAQLRPTSSYTHASIATVKLRLGQFDRDFSAALVKASAFGPWEPLVQEQVMGAGFPAWLALSEPVRAAVRGNLERALAMDPARAGRFLRANRGVLPPCEQLRMAVPGYCPAP